MRLLQLLISLADITAPFLIPGFTAGFAPDTARADGMPRNSIAVGSFDSRSGFLRGAFSGAAEHLGSQARTILIDQLQQTQRFQLLDRENLAQGPFETGLRGTAQQIQEADHGLKGGILQLGCRDVGDTPFSGVPEGGKCQVAYAQVALNIVDLSTSEVVHSVQGAGEYRLSQREITGFGDSADCDATLGAKVLKLALREAVDRLVDIVDAGQWPARPALPATARSAR